MNINNNKMNDLDSIFTNRWKANNYNYNGVKDEIDKNKQHFNRMFNIKDKEEKKREIRYANSVEGRVNNLEQSMRGLNSFNRNNFK